ncbi:MAG: hypothetical protein J6T33_04025 [Bacteroidales bacterium]|nr:hypothetical protein [Bacteroidales bacterium]
MAYQSFYNFSKTSFVRGIQCRKLIYLDKYKKQFKTPPDAETLFKFKMGRAFEAVFKAKFTNGLDISAIEKYPSLHRVQLTMGKLAQPGEVVLFEANIFYSDILVLTDVLRKNADGTYDIFEVKHSDKVNSAIEWDLPIQYYVCKNALGNIRTFNLVNRKEGTLDEFVVTDMKETCEERLPEVERCLAEFRDVLQGLEPEVEMGPQCEEPYKCDFQNYCRQLKAFRNS